MSAWRSIIDGVLPGRRRTERRHGVPSCRVVRRLEPAPRGADEATASVAHAVLARLRGRGAVPIEELVRDVAEELHAEACRAFPVLDLGFVGCRAFVREAGASSRPAMAISGRSTNRRRRETARPARG